MNLNIDYNVVMYIIIGLMLLYIVFIAIGSGNVVEGMEKNNKNFFESITEDDVKKIKKQNKRFEDSLLIEKYKGDYEDYVTELEESLNLTILSTLLMNPELKEKDIIDNVNKLYNLRDNLASTMDFIDSKKSSSTSSRFF